MLARIGKGGEDPRRDITYTVRQQGDTQIALKLQGPQGSYSCEDQPYADDVRSRVDPPYLIRLVTGGLTIQRLL
jgi:hypothetical protein